MKRTTELCHERNEQAEELFLNLMGPDATPEDWDRHEYLARTSAEYRSVFAQCERIWQRLDQIGAARLSRSDLAGTMNTGRYANADTLTLVQPENTTQSTRPSAVTIAHGWSGEWRRPWAIAALALVALIVGGLGVQNLVSSTPEELRYATLTGEHKEIELPDGSSLLLGARSSVTVRYAKTARLIEFGSGELLATVSHDDSRPFILVTDDMMVMATGTAFNMRNGTEYSTVSVVEGSVRVVPQLRAENVVQLRPKSAALAPGAFDTGTSLRHGQQLRAAKNAELGSIKEVDIKRVISWQSGQLYFLEDDLSTVFEAVMRYSNVTFQLTDKTLRERIYTGSFRPDSLEAWLDAMERAYSLKATRIGADWIVIAPTG